jgi:hypothetical protein
MTDVSNVTGAAPTLGLYDMRTAISPGDLGNIPALIAATEAGSKTPLILGVIIGKTSGISFRNNPNGEMPSVALRGIFEFIPNLEVSPGMVGLRAPLLYLPTNVQQIFLAGAMKRDTPIPAKVERGKSIDAEGNEVQIKVQMGVRRHPSPIGYQYLAMMLQDMTVVDPLADMRNDALKLFGRAPLQISSRVLPTDKAALAEAAGGMGAAGEVKAAPAKTDTKKRK